MPDKTVTDDLRATYRLEAGRAFLGQRTVKDARKDAGVLHTMTDKVHVSHAESHDTIYTHYDEIYVFKLSAEVKDKEDKKSRPTKMTDNHRILTVEAPAVLFSFNTNRCYFLFSLIVNLYSPY